MCAIRNGTLRICFERLVNPRGAGRRGYTRATLARRRTGRRRYEGRRLYERTDDRGEARRRGIFQKIPRVRLEEKE